MNETEIVDRQAAKIANMAADVQAKLDDAEPVLQAAIEAVNCITSEDITFVKGMGQPSEKIVLVMKCVFIYLESPKKKWEDIQKALTGVKVSTLKQKCEKAELIPDKIINQALKLMNDKNWDLNGFKSVHSLCYNMGMWCEEIAKCSKIKKKVVPIQKELEIKNQEKAEAEAKLKIQQDKLKEVQDKVQALKDNYQKTVDEIDLLHKTIDINNKKLE